MSFQAAIPLQHCISHYLSEWKERVFDWKLLDGGFVLHRAWKGKDDELNQLLVASRFQGTLVWHWGNTSFFKVPSPNTGGSLVSVCLMCLQRNILLQVQTHSSCRVKGWARKWWVDYSQPGRFDVHLIKPWLFWWMYTHSSVCNTDVLLVHSD